MMRPSVYYLDGVAVDVLDLKALLITRGINVPDEIVGRFAGSHRLAPTGHPFACNCLVLPGRVPIHIFTSSELSNFGPSSMQHRSTDRTRYAALL